MNLSAFEGLFDEYKPHRENARTGKISGWISSAISRFLPTRLVSATSTDLLIHDFAARKNTLSNVQFIASLRVCLNPGILAFQ
jgi:hypothetical protein